MVLYEVFLAWGTGFFQKLQVDVLACDGPVWVLFVDH